MIRFLSLLTIALWAAAILLLVTDAESNAPAAVVLIIVAVVLSAILAVRSAVMRVRGVVADARGFMSGDMQQARLVSVDDPSGWFSPSSGVTLEFQGADGKTHTFEHDVPVPFPIAWGYRLGRRFKVPGLRSMDISALMATELRREGLKLSVGRPDAAETTQTL